MHSPHSTSKHSIRLVSCDLNGTLVHQHTMMDMIRVKLSHEPQRFQAAKETFSKQTSGQLSFREAFEIAGPLTRGLTLRQAIDYACHHMKFLSGWHDLLDYFRTHQIYFVINSTGYSVTLMVIRECYGNDVIRDVICNRLIFGAPESSDAPVDDNYIRRLVHQYFQKGDQDPIFDAIRATGVIELGLADESEKASRLFQIARHLGIDTTQIAHVGDTMGDSAGILEVAQAGGMGIAFNYNAALGKYLEPYIGDDSIPGTITRVAPKSSTSDLRQLLGVLFG